ncbi:polysaccharide deacetylase family protein [Candidatus Kaiserbacteria bacterium]|nr:polysaccharide deacetylase family protein [Candidatus Kaiserbacteria bacterium]
MKHLIRDLLVNSIWFSTVARRYASRHRQHGPLVRILCLHDVQDRDWFSNLVANIKSKYHIISPSDFHNRKFNPDKINILLTFDDGYQSWIDVVLPILDEHNIKVLFFISSGLLDIADDKVEVEKFMKQNLCIKPRQPLTWEGVDTLVASGHTIGGHTVNHKDLTTLSLADLSREINDDKTAFSTKLNIELSDFAYPFGTKRHFNDQVRQQAKTAGYSYIYSAIAGFVADTNTDIPRLLLENRQSISQVNKWIEGAYDVFCMLKS